MAEWLTTDSAGGPRWVVWFPVARENPAAAAQWRLVLPSDTPNHTELVNGALSYWVLADARGR